MANERSSLNIEKATDTSLNLEFNFKIYVGRYRHYDLYKLKRTSDGWEISGGPLVHAEKSDYGGYPAVFQTLKHDGVSYPHDAGLFLENIWRKAASGASKKDVGKAIRSLASWISKCESLKPTV